MRGARLGGYAFCADTMVLAQRRTKNFSPARAGSDRLGSSLASEAALDADDHAFPGNSCNELRKVAKNLPGGFNSLRQIAICLHETSLLNLYLSNTYPRFGGWPAAGAINRHAASRSSWPLIDISAPVLVRTASPKARGAVQGRGGFEGSGQEHSLVRLHEQTKNMIPRACQEISFFWLGSTIRRMRRIIPPPATTIQLDQKLL